MSDIPTTYVAIDGLDPDEITDTEIYQMGQAITDYVRETFAPDRLDVYVSADPVDCPTTDENTVTLNRGKADLALGLLRYECARQEDPDYDPQADRDQYRQARDHFTAALGDEGGDE